MSFIKRNILDKDNNRFDDIINTYLSKLEFIDLQYLNSDDLINLIPKNNHDDLLLMTILVKRYLINKT